MQKLSGLDIAPERTAAILQALGFKIAGKGASLTVVPPTWRRDVEGKADLVEEVARIVGFAALPAVPLPEVARPTGGISKDEVAEIAGTPIVDDLLWLAQDTCQLLPVSRMKIDEAGDITSEPRWFAFGKQTEVTRLKEVG